MLRDRDGLYGAKLSRRVAARGIEERPTAPHAPWQNPYVERLVGTIRREYLDQIIVIDERHLQAVLEDYFDYYHRSRPHRSLTQDSPIPRAGHDSPSRVGRRIPSGRWSPSSVHPPGGQTAAHLIHWRSVLETEARRDSLAPKSGSVPRHPS